MKKDKEIIFNGDNYITKSKELLNVNHALSLTEQKFLLCIASNIEQSNLGDTSYIFSINDFRQFINSTSRNYYHKFYKMCNEFQEKFFVVYDPEQNCNRSFRWFSDANYNYQRSSVTVKLSPYLEKLLCPSHNDVVKYKIKNIRLLRSAYSIKLYEILKFNEREQEYTVSFNELRELLGLSNKYPVWNNFKQRILENTQNEINTKTDIKFEFSVIKKDRTVSKIKFNILSKSPSYKTNDKGLVKYVKGSNLESSNTKYTNNNVIRKHIQIETNFSDGCLDTWLRFGEEKLMAAIQMADIKERISSNLVNLLINEFIQEQRFDEMLNESCLSFEWILKVKAIDKFQKYMPLDESKKIWDSNKEKIINELSKYN